MNHVTSSRLHDALHHAVTVLGLLAVVALIWAARPQHASPPTTAASAPAVLDMSADFSPSAATFPTPSVPSRKIKDLRPGHRVLALNPDLDATRTVQTTAVDPPRYRLVSMRIAHHLDDGAVEEINIQSLQPTSWLTHHNVERYRTAPVPVDLEELGIHGTAVVTAIEPCPPLEPGPGAVVLTTVNHVSDAVYELTVATSDGLTETLTPTANQPFYCLDENDWLRTEELLEGDRLRTHNGQVTVTSVKPRPGRHRVYNLTVETEHAYHVSALGVVSHNVSCSLNAKTSMADNHVYAIYNKNTNDILKVGISAKGVNSAGKSFRAQRQLKHLAEKANMRVDELDTLIVLDQVKGRAVALLEEKGLVGMLRSLGHQLPANLRPKGELFP